jgi:hypothetical protein
LDRARPSGDLEHKTFPQGPVLMTAKRPRDPNQLAKSIIDIATGQKPDRDPAYTARNDYPSRINHWGHFSN